MVDCSSTDDLLCAPAESQQTADANDEHSIMGSPPDTESESEVSDESNWAADFESDSSTDSVEFKERKTTNPFMLNIQNRVTRNQHSTSAQKPSGNHSTTARKPSEQNREVQNRQGVLQMKQEGLHQCTKYCQFVEIASECVEQTVTCQGNIAPHCYEEKTFHTKCIGFTDSAYQNFRLSGRAYLCDDCEHFWQDAQKGKTSMFYSQPGKACEKQICENIDIKNFYMCEICQRMLLQVSIRKIPTEKLAVSTSVLFHVCPLLSCSSEKYFQSKYEISFQRTHGNVTEEASLGKMFGFFCDCLIALCLLLGCSGFHSRTCARSLDRRADDSRTYNAT